MLAVRFVVGWGVLLGAALFTLFLLTATGPDHAPATIDMHDLVLVLGDSSAPADESCAETPERGWVENVPTGRVSEC